MQLVFREGGQAGLDAINNIIKNAPPIETLSSYEMSPVDTYESNDNYRENYSYQYDPSTGQTSFVDRSEYPSQPYGIAFSQTVEVGGYWYNSFDSTDDWGVAELDTSFDTGYLNLSAPSGDIWGWWVRGQGYPGDLQDMYLIGGNIINNTAYQFVFNNTSEPGMSGGPVLDSGFRRRPEYNRIYNRS